MTYLFVILLIGLFIFIHELGHFLAARLSGIPIEKFSIGFGPSLISKKVGDTEYSISLIPLGGYVAPRIKEVEELYNIPWGRRMFFALGGPMMNLAAAVFGLMLLSLLSGTTSLHSIFIDPIVETGKGVSQLVSLIPTLFEEHQSLSGIVGIVSQGGSYIGFSLPHMLQFSVMLNINLAVFNLLPLPPLDGGNIVLYLLEKIHPKFLRLHMPMAVTGWVLIIGLMAYATVLDIGRIATGAYGQAI